MNILIVDDQPNVLASLIHSIDWKSIGIQNVFAASSALSGKQILQQQEIGILMTDIEMPVENGLSLIKWAKENGFPVEAVLLTSHASFYYAKEAISLGVIEYVMQPARNEEIIQAIVHAKERAEEKQHLAEKLKIHSFSAHEQNLAAKRFLELWPDPSSPDFSSQLDSKIRRLNALGLTCHAGSTALLFLTQVTQWNTIPIPALELMASYQYTINNIFSFLNTTSTSFSLNETSFISLCFPSSANDLPIYFQQLSDAVRQNIKCRIRIDYAVLPVEALSAGIERLKLIAAQSLPEQAPSIQQVLIKEPDSASQATANYQKYFNQIEQYITRNIQEPITRANLAEHLHLSPDYVSHIVRILKNCSCKEWITRRKMEYARYLIQNTALPIGEIAVRCGYDSFAYFSKVYKLYFNTTPRNDRADK